ncbi:MAG: hypothetical protein U1F67_20885 [Rubrivivax sp.]
MSVPKRAERSFQVFMGAQLAVFVALGIVLNLMIWLLIVRPVLKLAALADRVSRRPRGTSSSPPARRTRSASSPRRSRACVPAWCRR